MLSLLQLPQNIWRDNVVRFLPTVEDLGRLDSAVANKSDRATFHANICGCTRFSGYNDGVTGGKLRWIAVRDMVVDRIELNEEPEMDDMTYIKKVLSNVSWLRFSREALSKGSDLLRFVCSETLIYLCFIDCKVTDISGISACRNLVELQMHNCPKVTEISFVKGISGCVKLQYCFLSRCTYLHADSVAALLASCALLKSVELTGYFDLHQTLTQFSSVSNLTSLTCSDPHGGQCLKGAALRAMATSLPKLTHLSLDYQYSTVADADIEVLVRGCKCLTFLKLPRMPHVTNGGVYALSSALTQLRTLYLSNLAITDAAVQAVGTYCRVLQSLYISDCPLLTDAAFSTLNVTCLGSLSVNGTRVTGTFASYVLSPQSVLRRFNCFVGEHLNVDFVHSLTRNTTVTSLFLGKNQLTEADWLEVSTKFPNLTMLYLDKASLVDDAIALSFYKHCLELRNFVITDCNVSPEVMTQIKTRR